MTEHSTDERPEPDLQEEVRIETLPDSETETVVESADAPAPDAAEGEPEPATSRVDRLENEGEIAADYLEELLDIADLDGARNTIAGSGDAGDPRPRASIARWSAKASCLKKTAAAE
jgi:hypothetical protein